MSEDVRVDTPVVGEVLRLAADPIATLQPPRSGQQGLTVTLSAPAVIGARGDRRPRPAHLWRSGDTTARFQEDAVIVKLRPTSAPVRAVARAMRAGTAVADMPSSFISRLVENGYATSVDPVFRVEATPDRVPRHARFLAAAVERPDGPSNARGLVEVRVDRGVDAHQLARELSAAGGEVEYAHVPSIRRPFTRRPSRRRPRTAGPDPLTSRQWAHGAVRIAHARKLPGFLDGSTQTVAIVDSGIDPDHPDLQNVIVEYRNFVSKESDRDFIGHGTHVAGIIAAVLNNRIGIAGLCGARILALKALARHDRDFSAKEYYRALRYTIGRARVLNLSLGGEKDPSEIDVLRDVIEAGVVVVAAMGNEFEEGNPVEYPAGMEAVCAVGATDQLDRRATFSNTGPHIDIVAPGVEILSTTPTYLYDDGRRNYDSWDGTSMATPHVAAAAALLAAKHPRWAPARIIARLKRTADLVQGRTKRSDDEFGAGRLNIESALR